MQLVYVPCVRARRTRGLRRVQCHVRTPYDGILLHIPQTNQSILHWYWCLPIAQQPFIGVSVTFHFQCTTFCLPFLHVVAMGAETKSAHETPSYDSPRARSPYPLGLWFWGLNDRNVSLMGSGPYAVRKEKNLIAGAPTLWLMRAPLCSSSRPKREVKPYNDTHTHTHTKTCTPTTRLAG